MSDHRPTRNKRSLGPRGNRLALPLLAALTLLLPAAAVAQKYPERPVRVVNTFPAGGSGDAVLRIVFEKVGAALGQPFVIDTRPGAAGAIGTGNIATSPADGYSLLLGTASTFGTNPAAANGMLGKSKTGAPMSTVTRPSALSRNSITPLRVLTCIVSLWLSA